MPLTLLSALLLLLGCSLAIVHAEDHAEYSRIRLVFASPTHYDQFPSVSMSLNNSQLFDNVEYGTISKYAIVWPGHVESLTINDISLNSTTMVLEAEHDYTIILHDTSRPSTFQDDPDPEADVRRLAILDDSEMYQYQLDADMAVFRIVQLLSPRYIPHTHAPTDDNEQHTLSFARGPTDRRLPSSPTYLSPIEGASLSAPPPPSITLVAASALCKDCALFPIIRPMPPGTFIDIDLNTASPFYLAIANVTAHTKPDDVADSDTTHAADTDANPFQTALPAAPTDAYISAMQAGVANASSVLWASERVLIDLSDEEHGVYTLFLIPPVYNASDATHVDRSVEFDNSLLLLSNSREGEWPFFPLVYAAIAFALAVTVVGFIRAVHRECTASDSDHLDDIHPILSPAAPSPPPAPSPAPDAPLLAAPLSLDSGHEPRQPSLARAPTDLAAAATPDAGAKERLLSLDTMRGMVVSLMIFAYSGGGGYQTLQRSTWHGLVPMDLVFPCFLFVMGASYAFSLRTMRDRSRCTIITKTAIRSTKLFLVGTFLNDVGTFHDFRVFGILQRLALTNFMLALVALLTPGAKQQPRRGLDDINRRDFLQHVYSRDPADAATDAAQPDASLLTKRDADSAADAPIQVAETEAQSVALPMNIPQQQPQRETSFVPPTHQVGSHTLTSFNDLQRQARSQGASRTPLLSPAKPLSLSNSGRGLYIPPSMVQAGAGSGSDFNTPRLTPRGGPSPALLSVSAPSARPPLAFTLDEVDVFFPRDRRPSLTRRDDGHMHVLGDALGGPTLQNAHSSKNFFYDTSTDTALAAMFAHPDYAVNVAAQPASGASQGCMTRLLEYYHTRLVPQPTLDSTCFSACDTLMVSLGRAIVYIVLVFSEVCAELWTYKAQWLAVSLSALVWWLITQYLPVPGCPTGYLGAGGYLSDYGAHQHAPGLCTGGAAGYIDRAIFGAHIEPNPTARDVFLTGSFDSEGLLGTLTSLICAFMGLVAGRVVIAAKSHRARIFRWILWGGICLLGTFACVGFSADMTSGAIPVNKNLFTISFALVSSACALFCLAALYICLDVLRVWSGRPFFYVGLNSIVIFVLHRLLSDKFPFSWTVYGTTTHTELLFMSGNCIVWMVVVAYFMYSKKIFLRL